MRALDLTVFLLVTATSVAQDLERVSYNHPGLVVDLGVGLWAWPLPMDFDGDGDLDLVVSCPDKPYNGTYFFENPGSDSAQPRRRGRGGSRKAMPVFKPGKRLGPGHRNIRVSMIDGKPRVLLPGQELVDFPKSLFSARKAIYPRGRVEDGKRIRANQWQYTDHDGDGAVDLLVGVGDWTDYGWDDAFDANGKWTRGPLHGHVYLLRNEGTSTVPNYGEPTKLEAGGEVIDVFGWPSPCPADFDGDGDLDLVCGEFLDGLTYFENTGSRKKPVYAAGRRLRHARGEIRMDLQMIVPVAVDQDGDGDVDLVVGEEDGRVAFIENITPLGRGGGGEKKDGLPLFAEPRFFRQQAADVKFGALVTPYSVDWDDDGDEDLVCGNTAGYIGFIENLDAGVPPRWAAPRYLAAAGKIIRIQAGSNGSIQGPCEAKWGYTTLSVADWDHDGRKDIVVNSIWGRVVWYRNVGAKGKPELEAAKSVEVEWTGKPPKPAWNWWSPQGKELVTQWRTTPVVVDLDRDGLLDLVMLDHEGELAFFRREKRNDKLVLHPGRRIFRNDEDSMPVKLVRGTAGKSGRRKLTFTDWDGDGHLDVLFNSTNAELWVGARGKGGLYSLDRMGPIGKRKLAGHTSSPTTVDWDKNGQPDLLVGAEDGFLYYMKNPRPIQPQFRRRK